MSEIAKSEFVKDRIPNPDWRMEMWQKNVWDKNTLMMLNQTMFKFFVNLKCVQLKMQDTVKLRIF